MWNFLSKLIYFIKQRFSSNDDNKTTTYNVNPNHNIEKMGSTSFKRCECCDGTGLKPYTFDIEQSLPSRFGEMENWESSKKCPVCKGTGYIFSLSDNQPE